MTPWRRDPGSGRFCRDPLDPRWWPLDLPYVPVWLGQDARMFCVVDREDAAWVDRYLWSVTRSKTPGKFYASRVTRLGGAGSPCVRFYLHMEILDRMGAPYPSAKHTMGDHVNGNSLDNRRCNLRRATPSMNALNRRSR